MNELQLKALMLSVIMEIKYGQPLAPNAFIIKNIYKQMVGAPKNVSNKILLKKYIQFTYYDNKDLESYHRTMSKFFKQKSRPNKENENSKI